MRIEKSVKITMNPEFHDHKEKQRTSWRRSFTVRITDVQRNPTYIILWGYGYQICVSLNKKSISFFKSPDTRSRLYYQGVLVVSGSWKTERQDGPNLPQRQRENEYFVFNIRDSSVLLPSFLHFPHTVDFSWKTLLRLLSNRTWYSLTGGWG